MVVVVGGTYMVMNVKSSFSFYLSRNIFALDKRDWWWLGKGSDNGCDYGFLVSVVLCC